MLGIPFDFTARPVVAPPQKPRETVQVRAVSPERDDLEIRFPRVLGYRVELPDERLDAEFTDDSTFELTPALIGPTRTRNEGIIGEGVDLDLDHLEDMRPFDPRVPPHAPTARDEVARPGRRRQAPPLRPVEADHAPVARPAPRLQGRDVPGAAHVPEPRRPGVRADHRRHQSALSRRAAIKAVLDPYNPSGSTRHVRFTTSKSTRWETDPRLSHVNYVVCDSDWEAEFCRVVEGHPRVRAYVKNQGLGLEVPYLRGAEPHRYIPDFVVLVDDGHGDDDLLHLVVEIKGYRGDDAKVKKSTMETYWVPGVNHLGSYGRWAFAEFTDVWAMQDEFEAELEAHFDRMIDKRHRRRPGRGRIEAG